MKSKTFSGVVWTATQSWGVQLISLLVFLLLARLLEPSAFGLVAMAGLYIHVSSILVDQGLSAAVIQKEKLEPEHLDTAFWMSVCFGLLLVGAGWAVAEPIARLFREPELVPVIRVLSFNFLFTSLSGVQDALLRRNFQFKLLALRSLIAAVGGGLVGLGMAANGWGVMSLVWQQISTSAIGVLLLWSVSGWRPRFHFVWPYARELGSFGINIVGMRLLHAIGRRSDDLLIGYFLGAVTLGYYAVAYKLIKHLIDVLTKIISRVALPTFATLQNNHDELVRAFGKSIKLSSGLAFPAFVGLGLLAPEIVPALFGEQWSPSIPVMQVLTIMGAVAACQVLCQQLLIALGQPAWAFRMALINASLVVVGFFLMVSHGIVAVAAVYGVVGLLLLPAYMGLVHRLTGFGPSEFARYLRTPMLATIIMALVIAPTKAITLELLPGASVIGFASLLGLSAYLITLRIVDPDILNLKNMLLGAAGKKEKVRLSRRDVRAVDLTPEELVLKPKTASRGT